ncbi:unnamed protein product [Trichobilharzia szidati]|nr:unnamed protein product [Trichobilharzia szidati]
MSEICIYSKSDETVNITSYGNPVLSNINNEHKRHETNDLYNKALWVISKLQNNESSIPVDVKSNDNQMDITQTNIVNNLSVSTNHLKYFLKMSKIKTKLKSSEHLISPVSGVYILPPEVSHLNISNESSETKSCTSKNNDNKNVFSVIRSLKATKMLAKIPNRIGEYICQLCFKWFPDAFSLAEHPCPCMANLAYPCEICGKVFNCPANLASHQRWHRPRTSNHKSIHRNAYEKQNPQTQLININISNNYNVDNLLKQNHIPSESVDRQNTSFYSEHINNVFRTNKRYKIQDEEVNAKINKEEEMYNNFEMKPEMPDNHEPPVTYTASTMHISTKIHYSSSSVNIKCSTTKRINPFSVEALLA